jgi:hypothetical protein
MARSQLRNPELNEAEHAMAHGIAKTLEAVDGALEDPRCVSA